MQEEGWRDEDQALLNNRMIDYQWENNHCALFKSCIYRSFKTLSDGTNRQQAMEGY